MTRSKYIICFIVFYIFMVFLSIVERAIQGSLADSGVMAFFNALKIFVVFIFGYFCVAKRLKYIGLNTYYAWLIIIPLFGFIFCIYLCIKKSEEKKIFNNK